MASTSGAPALPAWARGEVPSTAICRHGGHAQAHPVKAVTAVTDWFGQTEGEVYIGWRRVKLPLPVCRRHLSKIQESWRKTAAQRERMAATEKAALELREALDYFHTQTGLHLDAGLDHATSPNIVFTLNATQLRHLADAVDNLFMPGGPDFLADGTPRPLPEEVPPGTAAEAIGKVIQFPGGRY